MIKSIADKGGPYIMYSPNEPLFNYEAARSRYRYPDPVSRDRNGTVGFYKT